MAKEKLVIPEASEMSESYYFTEGTSDKEYHVTIVKVDDQWSTEVHYGKRGQALTHGLKTKAPTDFETAYKAYAAECSNRLKKGYTKDLSGKAWGGATAGTGVGEHSGVQPQLLNPMTEKTLEAMIKDPSWVLQEKFNGRRWMGLSMGELKGVNKKGLVVPLKNEFKDALLNLGVCEIDGENMGSVIMAFDLLSLEGNDLREKPYEERIALLENLVKKDTSGVIKVVFTARTEEDKRALVDKVRGEKGEGIVGKMANAAYSAGRPASGGSQMKYKFLETCTMQVSSINEAGTSFAFHAIEGEEKVPQGNVGIPANKPVPEVGDFVEIRYQPAAKGGMLYQPFYLGIRDDQGPEDCGLKQIVYQKTFIADDDADDVADTTIQEEMENSESKAPGKKRKPG